MNAFCHPERSLVYEASRALIARDSATLHGMTTKGND